MEDHAAFLFFLPILFSYVWKQSARLRFDLTHGAS